MSIKNPYWNKREVFGPARTKKNGGMAGKLMRLPKRMLFTAVIAAVTLANRLIDAARPGDCLMLSI